MSTQRLALGVSLGLHVVLVLMLALTRRPEPPASPSPAHVTLLVAPDQATTGTGPFEGGLPRRADGTPAEAAPQDRIVAALPAPAAPRVWSAPSAATDTGRPLPMAGDDPPALEPEPYTASPDRLPSPADVLALLPGIAAAEATPANVTGSPEPHDVDASVQAEASFGPRMPRSQPQPEFPDVLRREGREADVRVRVRIDASGAVVGTTVEVSSGDTGVDNAVERVVRGYLFDRTDGDTIDEGVVTFHFRLKRGF